MSRFFRGTDDSSSPSDSDTESDHQFPAEEASRQTATEAPGSASDPGSRSMGQTEQTTSTDNFIAISNQQNQPRQVNNGDASQHQTMLIAALLEEHYRNRAAEFLNSTNPGRHFTKHSPEVQPHAQRLFRQATATLSSTGILNTHVSSEALRDTRAQYLAGIDQLGAGASPNSLLSSVRQLNLHSHPHPAADQQLVSYHPPTPKSHYYSSFREVCLLGRGGFGRVFKCHNLLDQKMYAVKKIPLSPQLSRSFCEGKHEELQHVLLEVQTLASLDHANVVRYHATWVEELPTLSNAVVSSSTSGRHATAGQPIRRTRQLLLENTADADTTGTANTDELVEAEQPASCGFVFAEDSEAISAPSGRALQAQEETENSEGLNHASESSANPSDIFTDGTRSHLSMVELQDRRDPNSVHTHELYIQMSLYPMTLHQYLAPTNSSGGTPRHCYHLLPSLQIFMAILSGLRYIWSKRLIHRDVKPRNIFLSEPETEPLAGYCSVSCQNACHGCESRWLNPRIGDFGLVTELAHGEITDEDKTSRKAVGTPLYRPPACMWDGKSDPTKTTGADNEKVDIFALGVVFVELLCPFATVMERADALSGLQKGVLPKCMRERLERESQLGIVDRVLEMAAGMVNPDPTMRWNGEKIAEAAGNIKAMMDEANLAMSL